MDIPKSGRKSPLPGPAIIAYTASPEEKDDINSFLKANGLKQSPWIMGLIRKELALWKRRQSQRVS